MLILSGGKGNMEIKKGVIEKVKERLPVIDNLKGFLIFCVVLGHCMEVAGFPYSKLFYCVIYLFHMPAFVFLSGYCCNVKESKRSIFQKYLYPYVVWQFLFFVFCHLFLGMEGTLRFFVPYWYLWYLLSLFFWHFMIRIFETESGKLQIFSVLLFVVLGLFMGYLEKGYDFLEISRTVVFFPFFLAGYYFQKRDFLLIPNRGLKRIVTLLVPVVFVGLCMFLDEISHQWMFHSLPYDEFGYQWWIRLLLILCGGIVTLYLWFHFPKKRVFLLTSIGQNSMAIYILHGFVILYLKCSEPIRELFFKKPYLIFLSGVLLTVVFSRKFVMKIMKPLLRWPFGNYGEREKER